MLTVFEGVYVEVDQIGAVVVLFFNDADQSDVPS